MPIFASPTETHSRAGVWKVALFVSDPPIEARRVLVIELPNQSTVPKPGVADDHGPARQTTRATRHLLVLLLIGDVTFMLLHIALKTGWISNPQYSVEMDRGYAEIYLYVQEYWAALLLIAVGWQRKRLIYPAWGLAFAYFVLDDSLQIHERLGGRVARALDLQPMIALRAQDFGELLVTVVAAAGLFLLIGICHWRSGSADRRISRHLFWLVVALAGFGVVTDMLHIMIPWGTTFLGLVEDGGEMVVISFVVAYAFGQSLLTRKEQRHPREPHSSPFVP